MARASLIGRVAPRNLNGTWTLLFQYFDVDPDLLEEYGALDIYLVSDLPLVVDPFLLFNSMRRMARGRTSEPLAQQSVRWSTVD